MSSSAAISNIVPNADGYLPLDGVSNGLLSATKKLYLDGGSDTYLVESSANVVDLYVNNINVLKATATGVQAGLSQDSAASVTLAGSVTFDFNYGYKKVTLSGSGALTINVSNAIAGRAILIECVNWGLATSIVYNAHTKTTEGGIAITFTSSGTDLLQVFYNGTSYIYTLVAQDVK